jgi:hypothetical protein
MAWENLRRRHATTFETGVFGGPRHVRNLLGQLAAVFFLVGWAVAGPRGGFLVAAGPLAYSTHAPKDKHICPLLLPSVIFWTKPTFAPCTPQNFCTYVRDGEYKGVLLNN